MAVVPERGNQIALYATFLSANFYYYFKVFLLLVKFYKIDLNLSFLTCQF